MVSVRILGGGSTSFGEHPDRTGRDMFALAIADFGEVKLTGHLRDLDPEEVAIGMTVAPAVGQSA